MRACRIASVNRKLARQNLRTAIWMATAGMFLFGLTFIVAAIYLSG
jgi:hypothetical protein